MPSAVIKSYRYDADREILEITYHSGKVYHYLQVPEKIFRQMRSTMVKGIWFNQHIKGKYIFKEVTPGLQQTDLFKLNSQRLVEQELYIAAVGEGFEQVSVRIAKGRGMRQSSRVLTLG